MSQRARADIAPEQTADHLARLDAWRAAPSPPRPACLLNPADWHRTREQAAQGEPPWPTIHARAMELLRRPEEPLVKENIPDGGALELAFAYAVWGQPAFRDAALTLAQRLLDATTWVWHAPLAIDLRSATITSSLALVYDLLGKDLADGEAHRLAFGVAGRDLACYPDIAHANAEWWCHSGMNWQGVIHSQIGLAALALRDRLPSWRLTLRQAVVGVLDFLDAQPPDGSYREGLQYWYYGVGEAAWFALVLKQATGGAVNLLQHPYFRATGEFALHMSTPDGCFDFGDCYNFRPGDWLLALLASEFRDPLLQAMVQPLDVQTPRFRKLDIPARAMRFALAFDPTLRPADAINASPGRVFSDSGLVCLRSDWGAAATYVGLQVGAPLAPHGHLDTGSFIVGSRGRRVVPDAGFWPYAPGFFEMNGRRSSFDGASMVGHSVLEIDGGGLKHGGAGGRLHSIDLQPHADAVVCDLTPAYGGLVERYFRYLLLIRPDTILVFDDVEGTAARSFQWNMQAAGQVDLKNDGLTIHDGPVTASVLFTGADLADGYRLTAETRISSYSPFVDDGAMPITIRRIHVSPIHPRPAWRFGALLQLGAGSCPPEVTFECRDDNGRIKWSIVSPSGRSVVEIDLAARRLRQFAD